MARKLVKPEELQHWQYTPFPSASSVRIIHLLQAKNVNDQLECRFIETTLESNPQYIAASYVWGDKANPSTILCHGTYLPITRNLDAALRRFRRESEDIPLWVDSICINQQDMMEVNHQVRLMGDIYRNASHVYVWLGIVPVVANAGDLLRGLRWFQRGWTLQELITPKEAVFFTATWKAVGTKKSLCGALSSLTGIPSRVLLLEESLHTASNAQKMSWASTRSTTREEDMAYCLLGPFDVSMPTLYGEGSRNGFRRLQEEIIKVPTNESIFAWHGKNERPGALAESPADFQNMGNVEFLGASFLVLNDEYYLPIEG
ncbi:HET-domain-containing protein [Mytilinidion resinicola]|uniref:HET-domain-containing protein n=1 Tax=Mytilinidion resinicola TaxID=574789 RepID=A0A6A6Y894_9PEZI|nr:HET-domain-containing protein [Mytilinidion resinicola]KAF2804773.1 HET-domain-containing protein [Mytilinidion resinicola]